MRTPIAIIVLAAGVCVLGASLWLGAKGQPSAPPSPSQPAVDRAPPPSADKSSTAPDTKPAVETKPAIETKPLATGPAKDTTFDDIKLELKKGDPYDPALLTDKVKKLDGHPIRIRGFILPSFQQSGIKQFVLVRDNQECCFGPGALLHDCIIVEMVPPATADFSTRPVSVEGTFSLRELKLDGKYLAIYHLDGKEVK
jgi:hypothetical protein